jgi:transcriptional regulator with GAF, ATPase, and Fis domain
VGVPPSKPPALVTLDPSQALAGEGSASRLRALYDIGRLLLQQTEPAQILAAIHETVVTLLAPERVALLQVDEAGGLRPLLTTAIDLDGAPDTWPLSQTVLRRVRDGGVAVLANNVAGDREISAAESTRRLGLRSVLCVPLSGAPVRGLIYLDSRQGEGRSFERDDLEFLTALAVQASLILTRVREHRQTAEALEQSRERLEALEGELLRHEIVGRSPKLLAAYESLRRLAAGGARVLLRGETGTGKELFARAYAANSPRRGRAYVPVPIPALAPTVAESELFGHVRGAFTEAARDKKGRLELAHGGVLFLDEVGDIDLPLQPKLLRFLDSGELYRVGDTEARHVDTLLVSATNRPLEKLMEQGTFREDLVARLGHSLHIPPLRDRPEDVPLLIEHFLVQFERGRRRKAFAPETLEMLQHYPWEFNVRQLRQLVEHTVCLVDRDVVRPDDLPISFRQRRRSDQASPANAADAPLRPLRAVVQDAEREHILRALARTGGNRRQAIEQLEVSPQTFYRRLEELGLQKKSDTPH